MKTNEGERKASKPTKTLLDHQKVVLLGVADNARLFRKELLKSLKWLKGDERESLGTWVRKHFSTLHQPIIDEVCYPYGDICLN